MRTLVIANRFPWPPRGGSDLRLTNLIETLAEFSDVELFVVTTGRGLDHLQVSTAVARMQIVPAPAVGRGLAHRLRWLFGSRLPNQLAGRDFSAARAHLASFVSGTYDLVWVVRASTMQAVGVLRDVPVIVDLDDLEDRKIATELSVTRNDPCSSKRQQLRRIGYMLCLRVDQRRWRRVQHRIADQSVAVVTCSDEDRRWLSHENAFVVPNGYSPPDRPVGKARVEDPPTLMLVASFTYGPNVDTAQRLVREILPRVRRQIPHAAVRLVGEHGGRLNELAHLDGVTVTGFVEDLASELSLASVVAVPLRQGGGTRIKILEAFAHRIPVVSSTVGCAGLDVVHGRHLLVADDPSAFSALCIEALTNVTLRLHLADHGEALLRERYDSRLIRDDISALALSAAGHRRLREAPSHG
jgi:glycosyltransferase involved in cell wall biosynthesis